MAGTVVRKPHTQGAGAPRLSQQDPLWLRVSLILFAVLFLTLFILVPVANVFYQAFSEGWVAYWHAFYVPVPPAGSLDAAARDALIEAAATAADNRSAIRMTLFVAALVVPLNTLFGLAAAWLLSRFPIRGRAILLTLVDLPFSISTVIVGLMFVLIFGAQGWLKPLSLPVIFHWPGVVLATMFVTLPFVARELIPVMEAQGTEEEQAALTLGATGWQTFRRITMVNIRWALLYGVILCNSRAMGEFGAVNVVSGNVRGMNTTLPLRIQQLYEDYNIQGAFAMATLLAALALLTLAIKTYLEHRLRKQ